MATPKTEEKVRHQIKGHKVRKSDIVRRLLMYMDESLFGDGKSTPMQDGKDWYKQANDFAIEMMDIYCEQQVEIKKALDSRMAKSIGISNWRNNKAVNGYSEPHVNTPTNQDSQDLLIKKMCGILAALSPQVTWEQNKKLAIQYLTTGYASTTKDRVKKCETIMACKTEDEIFNSVSIRGLKTRAFYLNISRPDIVGAVTIDRHAIASAMQLPHSAEALDTAYQSITPLQYEFFQGCYIEATYRWNAKTKSEQDHLTPHQFQAIVWVTYRKIRGLK